MTVQGLKDRKGESQARSLSRDNEDFLEDDNILITEGKTSAGWRTGPAVRHAEAVHSCAGAGPYAVMLLHDRDRNRKFGWRIDGIGFAGNPKLGWSKPDADKASATAGDGPTPVTIVLNYLAARLGPLKKKDWHRADEDRRRMRLLFAARRRRADLCRAEAHGRSSATRS